MGYNETNQHQLQHFYLVTMTTPVRIAKASTYRQIVSKTVTYLTVKRKNLKRSGRCFVCLKKNHISKECQLNNKCFKCGRRHFASLCNDQREPTGPNLTNHNSSHSNKTEIHASLQQKQWRSQFSTVSGKNIRRRGGATANL